MPSIYNTIVSRVVTEKQQLKYGAHRADPDKMGPEEVFKVALDATKPEIKRAIEDLFEVRVTKVRTLIQPARRQTLGRSVGHRPRWKKAYVTLAPGDSIPGLEG